VEVSAEGAADQVASGCVYFVGALLERASELRVVAERHDVSVGAVAVAWTLRNPAVDGAIVGFRRPNQVDAIVDAANLELVDDDIAEIEGGN
jgi:aryl-alcohol dehydrogenase-like predicted oxidoreductase